jgi:hypothetical protein
VATLCLDLFEARVERGPFCRDHRTAYDLVRVDQAWLLGVVFDEYVRKALRSGTTRMGCVGGHDGPGIHSCGSPTSLCAGCGAKRQDDECEGDNGRQA